MPKLKVMDSDALNAFATGMNEKQYSITVTSALRDRLNDQELEAVLGHELTHIRNGDVRMLVIAVVIAGVISFFAELVFRLMFQGGLSFRSGRASSDRKSGGAAGIAILIAIALIAIAWILSIVIRLALSRQREFLADAGSVELTKNPDAMIMALRKIEGRGELPGANSAVMEMCIDNPREGFGELFDTHPPIDKRIEALVKYAGGHDPGPIALSDLPQDDAQEQTSPDESGALPPQPHPGPWTPTGGPVPLPGAFLPPQSPIQLGGEPSRSAPAGEEPGPWGPHRDGGGNR
jgi:heat shock protein HtpX